MKDEFTLGTGNPASLGSRKAKHFFGFIFQIAAMFVTKIGSSLFIANYFIRRFHPHTSMIGCQHDFIFLSAIFFNAWCSGECSNHECNASITHFISCQFFQHFHFCSGMAEHIHKIVNDDIEIIVQQVMNIIYQLLPGLVIHDFGVRIFKIILS